MLMKAFILSLSILLFGGYTALADRFIIKGDTIYTDDKSPLESYPDIASLRKQLKDYESELCFDCSTAPYQAEWTIANDHLFLTAIYSASTKKHLKADINKLFYVNNNRVAANWVTQQIWIPQGQPVKWHDQVTPIYKAEQRLTIVTGKVVASKEFDYPTSRTLIDEKDPKVASKTVCSLINWGKIPDMQDSVVKVVLTFTTGESGKPENVKIVRPTYPSIYAEEAKKGFSLLAWPASYRHGEVLRESFGFPIVFSEEMRKKCAE